MPYYIGPQKWWLDIKYPGIVKDGLILNLDAGNPASYSGIGTTWYDLSCNGNDGTLVNGVGYDSANGGSLVFDGDDDYITLPNNFLSWDTGNPFTISVWFKTTSNGVILGTQDSSTPNSAGGWVPAIYVDSTGKLVTSCFWSGDSSLHYDVSPGLVNNGEWNNLTVTVLSNDYNSYLNGVAYSTLNKPQVEYAPTYYYFIGTGLSQDWFNSPTSSYLNANISNLLCGQPKEDFKG